MLLLITISIICTFSFSADLIINLKPDSIYVGTLTTMTISVNNLEDSFETYKRSTNRLIRELKQKISTIQDDINTLNEKVFPPAEEEGKKKK